MLRNIVAVIAGWLSGMLVWVALFALLFIVGHQVSPTEFPWPLPEKPKPPGAPWLALTLLIDMVMALVVGFVVVAIAAKPGHRVVIVAAVLLVCGLIVTAIGERDTLPLWVSWGRVLLAPPAVFLGAALRGMEGPARASASVDAAASR